MLRINQSVSADSARSYYTTADYYSEGQELVGVWRGKGAELLGLSGKVEKDAWESLCDNRDPRTGKTLTARRKVDQRTGYDFNFHVPKSLSVLYALTKDERLLDAFRDSVGETMQDMEAEMKTRVRAGAKNEDRISGNMVWGEFIHFTSRPVDGVPDPHLHAHCFVFNRTFDEAENRWKAGQFGDLKRDSPYFEAVFHSRLARKLSDLGIAVERTRKGWEVAGIPTAALDKFSRRTAQIEEHAREKGIVDPAEKSELGAKTRQRKRKDLPLDNLRKVWQERLTSAESGSLQRVERDIGGPAVNELDGSAAAAIEHAAEHCFERKSVLPEREFLREALRHLVGSASVSSVLQEAGRREFIRADREGRTLVTTPAVLAEERGMIEFARKGRGACVPLSDVVRPIKREWLNVGQRKAVARVLGSRDRVTLVRGAAGVGKTSMMLEAVEGIEAGGRKVFTFAPSAKASRGVLRQEGFRDAETVARLLVDEDLQAAAKGQVWWIDEAGLMGTRVMSRVFDLADKLDARLILSGDRKQHGSVERGAALRLLEDEAGLAPAEIKDIQRQKGNYKQVVQALSEGRTEDGFDQLDRLGWIRESGTADRYKSLAADYLAAVAEGKTALVVSPTHLEGGRITREIRAGLKAAGKLGRDEQSVTSLENLNLTPAERADAVNYVPGDVLVFHQNAKGFRKGECLVVGEAKLPLDQADRFQVFHGHNLPIAAGDVLRITRNGKTADGAHRLDNGDVFTVKNFTADGDIRFTNGWIVSRDYSYLARGFCTTSHASQGSTVDRVFIGQSSESFPASSREQFYVSVSRAREKVTVYTDRKQSLLEAVSRGDDRLSATDIVALPDKRARRAKVRRMQEQQRAAAGEAAARRHERQRQGVTYER